MKGLSSVESQKRVRLKGCLVKKIRQGLKDGKIVTCHHASALACMQCSTHACMRCSPVHMSVLGVHHACEVQFAGMSLPFSMQGNRELVHK